MSLIRGQTRRPRERYNPPFFLFVDDIFSYSYLAGELADKASEKIDEAKDTAAEVAADAKQAGQGTKISFKDLFCLCLI